MSSESNLEYVDADGTQQYVTIRLAGQLIGLPVLDVHDVLNEQAITRIPLAPSWVAGVLNLRGRIVTAIDLRERLGFPPQEDEGTKTMSVVVEHDGEPYSLLIDNVGEVLTLTNTLFEKNPITLDQRWREVAVGIYRLEDELLAVIDVDRLLDIEQLAQAA